LELLVDRKKTPVIAIAGGLSKVEAIKTIAARQPLPVINGLITDELTAMQLLK
jgi:DNA-binding transcriptional regulator LsrR (DeoR family)